MLHKVERAFSGGGLTRLRGEAVDPDQWRNGRRLMEQRFISPGPISGEPVECPCGRQWAGEVSEHHCEKPEAVMLEAAIDTPTKAAGRKAG